MIELLSAAGALAAGGGFAGYAVRGRSSGFFGPSVFRGDLSRPTVALTFDDGPSESTPALLEILAAEQVPATFFMCGRNVRRFPKIAREVSQSGHDVGNHTDTHPRLYFRSPEFIYRELALAQETIHLHTGVTPVFFRAPYGVRWFGLRRAQERLRLTGVMWTVIARDWTLPANRIFQRLIRTTSNGAILCLHDGRATKPAPDVRPMLDAVEQAIPILKDRGFQFQRLSEMITPQDWSLVEE
jgi:peptidoglycan-N-acetylglucosamine deacetylase